MLISYPHSLIFIINPYSISFSLVDKLSTLFTTLYVDMLITLDTKCMILKNYKQNSVYIYKKAVDNYNFIHNSC